ncbi:hypothetical protein PUR61_22180, partial [Streptomyces sp. BE20]|nr:hypothetical protein [Streptomyces sp. BE20]
ATLARGEDRRRALTVAVQERLLTVVFAPTGTPAASRIDLESLPYDRVPALVREATTTLGVGTLSTWQLTADRLTGTVVLRVSVDMAVNVVGVLVVVAAAVVGVVAL